MNNNHWKYGWVGLLFCLWGITFQACKNTTASENGTDWRTYGGNAAGTRYSELDQINLQNVQNLQLAWSYNTGENNNPDGKGRDIQCQPIVIDGVMYGMTPQMKLFAVEASTGNEIWKYDPFTNPNLKKSVHAVRGVTYWAEGEDKRILYSVGAKLLAINATTGKLMESFGENGLCDLHQGLGDTTTLGYDVYDFGIRSTTPGIVYKNFIIMGSSVSEGGDALPGHIRAFDVRTGKLAWVFRTIPLPGEYGYETWSKDSYKKIGGANCWAGMVLDEKRGMVFLGTGSPSVDFYGGDRKGNNLFANCVIALNAETGKRVWHFQTVHHDLWDRDIPCPPNLITVNHNGKTIDAVAQTTKDGLIFVFDRDNGTPLFPVKEVPVPKVPALPGEAPSPTQPEPTKPAPFANQTFTKADMSNISPEANAFALDVLSKSRGGVKNLPPSLQPTLSYGISGGSEWGGNAVDPNSIMYVNGNNMLWVVKMNTRAELNELAKMTKGERVFTTNCTACHASKDKNAPAVAGTQAIPLLKDVGKRLTREQIAAILESGRGRMPSFSHISKEDREAIVNFLLDTETAPKRDEIHQSTAVKAKGSKDFPYVSPYQNDGFYQFKDPEDYPAIKPPWGTLNAVNLNTGEYLWQVPFGEYPKLVENGIAKTGTENHGGAVVTAGGLLFIAATYDEKLKAYDSKTGKIVWEYKLPAGGFATPITYRVNGKQYIAIAAGGSRYGLKAGGTYVAFALP